MYLSIFLLQFNSHSHETEICNIGNRLCPKCAKALIEYLALELFLVHLLISPAIDSSCRQVLLLRNFQGVPDP